MRFRTDLAKPGVNADGEADNRAGEAGFVDEGHPATMATCDFRFVNPGMGALRALGLLSWAALREEVSTRSHTK
jgi:hypothetical protein